MLWHYSRCIEYLDFLWICITVPFQIFLVTAILRKFRNFKINKSFYLFYVINTFMDLINLFCVCFGMLFPAWGFFVEFYVKAGPNLGKWILVASFWARVSQGIACLLIAINRCSAILYPLSYEKIWNKTLISCAIFVQLFAGAPLAAFTAAKDYLWYVNISTAVEYNIVLEELVVEQNAMYWDQIQILKIIWRFVGDKVAVFAVGFVIETICCFLLIICYGIMGGVLWYRNKKSRNSFTNFYTPNVSQKTKINQQLFKMASWICSLEILFTMFLGVIVTIPIHPNLFYALYNTLSILYSTLNPYILVFCSQYTRNLCVATFRDWHSFFFDGEKRIRRAMPSSSSHNQVNNNNNQNNQVHQKRNSGSVITTITA